MTKAHKRALRNIMDIVKNSNVDRLGLKWIFIDISLILMAVVGVSVVRGGLNLGVDFTGGTLVYGKFKEEPQLERIRVKIWKGRVNV